MSRENVDVVRRARESGHADPEFFSSVEFSGTARASGVPITGKVFVVYWLRDDLIVRIEDYTERVDVRQAVGLGE